VFINFWYAAELSANLTTRPVRVRMLGQNFVLFRDGAGRAHCLSNVCLHRCGSLADGWVSNGRVVCPYHGWEFNGTGQCERIPSLGPGQAPMPARARVDSYPVQEKYGIVFAFLGDVPEHERPPIMELEEWDKPGWRCTTLAFSLKANYARVVENALDPGHAEYVHVVGHKGKDPNYRVPDYEVVSGPWGAGMEVRFRTQAGGLFKYLRKGESETVAGTTFHGPSQFVTRIRITDRMSSFQYAFDTPVDDFETRSFLVNARNFFTAPILDRMVDKRSWVIINEDKAVIEKIEPVAPPRGTTADFSVKSDAIQLVYRRYLQDWELRGWRIDSEALYREHPASRLHVIPSPGRRDSRNWVFDTVPLVPAATGRSTMIVPRPERQAP
jgi:phenylpropionate dioxygenase-like ring-hydroxylating dioxygenase large terminal subunit